MSKEDDIKFVHKFVVYGFRIDDYIINFNKKDNTIAIKKKGFGSLAEITMPISILKKMIKIVEEYKEDDPE